MSTRPDGLNGDEQERLRAQFFVNPKYVDFAARAAAIMELRLEHGRAKFGVDWDEEPYTDADNLTRLYRAVEHLNAAQRQFRDGTVGADEVAKRAADVANQAFMFADPARAVR